MNSSLRPVLDALHCVLRRVAEPNAVLRAVLDESVDRCAADRGLFVEVLDDERFAFSVLHRLERIEAQRLVDGFSQTVFREVLRTGTALVSSDARSDPRFAKSRSVQELRMVSVLVGPIREGDRITGLVHLERERPGHFTQDQCAGLDHLLELCGPVLGALRASRRLLDEHEELRDVVLRSSAELEESRDTLARDWGFGRFVGRSSHIRALEKVIRKAADSAFPVLLQGETGTGKTLLARILHHCGPRSRAPFVTVFCPSLERGMVETELFGHRKGAFTGAVGDRVGKVQTADKGTLFLDEIGELPPEIQPKLLRFLEQGAFERVGDPLERHADVRLVAASNRDLRAEVEAGRFRRDLFERLNYIPIRVPPLRERREDIPDLLRHTLDRDGAGRWVELVPEAALALRELEHAWPGNVREIEQLAARMTLERRNGAFSAEEVLSLLTLVQVTNVSAKDDEASALRSGLPAALYQTERRMLERALREHMGATRAELAARLRISERALFKKLRVHGLTAGSDAPAGEPTLEEEA